MQWMIRLVATSLLLTISTLGGVAHAQVPQTLNYQGYLTDSAGQALLSSEVVEFSIYAAETGGAPLWSEFQSVFPAQGLFSTTFGNAGNPFPPGMFNTPLFLGVKVGTDDEMTPRTALSAAAFSMKALDSETLSGFTSGDLDQSGDITVLTSNLSSTQADIASVQSTVGILNSDLSGVQNDIAVLDSDVVAVAGDISLIQSDVTGVESDITSIENTLVTKQNRITSSCNSGSSIRQVFSNGTVTCETDDASPWGNNGSTLNSQNLRVGIGTTAAAASLQIDAPVDVDPFRARVQSSTKLRVHTNGSVSVGSSSAGTENGLYVLGDTGIGTTSPVTRLEVADIDWQFSLDNNGVGGGDWYLGATADAWNSGGGKFLIGATTNSSQAALAIDASRNIGIATTSPTTRLHIGSGTDVSAASGGYLMMGLDAGSNIAIDNNEIMARNNGVATTLSLNAEGGEVRLNSAGSQDADALEVRGKVYFDNGERSGMRISNHGTGTTHATLEPTLSEEGLVGNSVLPFWRVYSREFYAQSSLEYRTYSDRSLKSNIATIDSALDKIQRLEGVSYALKIDPMGKRKRPLTQEEQFVNDNQVGFIAQDLAKVLPQLVTEDESTGLKTVAYMGVIPVLVEALKEQQKQLEAQRAELDELKARLK